MGIPDPIKANKNPKIQIISNRSATEDEFLQLTTVDILFLNT